MRVNGFPEVAPWGGPDAGVALVDLDNAILVKGILELQDIGPEDRFGFVVFGCLEFVKEIFGLKNCIEIRVFGSDNVPGSLQDKACIYNVEVCDSKPLNI
jgi:hypothetical protein